jgi:predicted ArsR family transcriptional regulator
VGSLVEPGLRDALLFARSRPEPVTADELAAAQRIHRNVARGRLERLVKAGLLIAGFERRSGRSGPGAGRPAKTYRVAPELTPLELPRRRYDQLLGLLVEALPSHSRAMRLREIGAEFGRSFARGLRSRSTLPGALSNACTALGRAGFQAAVAEVGDVEGLIVTPTCPLRPLVSANPSTRPLDRGLWEGLISRLLHGRRAEVICETSGCHDAAQPCLVRVRLVNTFQQS